jgi:hypothetical protein
VHGLEEVPQYVYTCVCLNLYLKEI